MKYACKFRNWLLSFCFAAALLCGLLTVSASAAELSPNEIQLTLTWAGVDTSAGSGVSDGDLVTAGNLTFYEDGIQQTFNGSGLIPIDASGTTIISYAFDPAKTYTVTVEEMTAAPYYMTKDIVLSADDVATAISTGLTISETVEWVQWSKPIKVSLVDSTGAPLSIQDANITLADIDNFTNQFNAPELRKTNVSGVATFPTHSYDPSDPSMTNILNAQVLLSATYPISGAAPTTIAKIVQLSWNPNARKNEVDLLWPTVTVSGTVRNSDGSPAANTRVAAYYKLPKSGQSIIDPFLKPPSDLSFSIQPSVYYTTTDSNGNYTLALPEGHAEICAGDGQGPSATAPLFTDPNNSGNSATKYYSAVSPHFPWISTIDNKRNYSFSFQSIFCQESAPLVLDAVSDMENQDLTLGAAANGYRLRANITLNGQPCTADMNNMSLTFMARSTTSPSNIHANGGGYTETESKLEVRDAVPNNGIDREGVKLAPGEYVVAFTCISDSFILKYAQVLPISVTISPSAVNSGVVDLGTLNFIATPRIVGGANAKTPEEILSHYKPIPAPVPYGYLSTRIEAVPDPAYGPFAYQFTVHYCGHHTGTNVTEMTGGKLEIRLPENVHVVNPGQMNSADGKLTMELPALALGKVCSTTFSADIKDASGDVTLELFSAPSYAGINNNATDELNLSSAITLNRPHITLNAPRRVEAANKFRVFGNAAGTDGTGIVLFRKGDGSSSDISIATGANKGRYYYFNVGGQAEGSYKLFTRTQRFNLDEDSNEVDVDVVASGAVKVEDAYIMRGSKRTDVNANFGMIYYTSFIANDKHVPAFDLYFKLSQAPAQGETVTLDIGGLSFSTEAPNSAHPDYYKASIGDLYASGEQSVLLKIGSSFTTQLACLMLLF